MGRSAFILLGIGVGQLIVSLCCAPVGDGLSSAAPIEPPAASRPSGFNPSQGDL